MARRRGGQSLRLKAAGVPQTARYPRATGSVRKWEWVCFEKLIFSRVNDLGAWRCGMSYDRYSMESRGRRGVDRSGGNGLNRNDPLDGLHNAFILLKPLEVIKRLQLRP